MKKTKIIATMWPAVESESNIIKLYKSWINIIRLNFSHASQDSAKKTITTIQKLNESGKTNLSLLLDTKWPELRIGDIPLRITYKKGETFFIYIEKDKVIWEKNIRCDYSFLIKDCKKGNIILIDSWNFKVKVTGKTKDYLEVKAMNAWEVTSRRHVNIPRLELQFKDILSEKDISDISFWAQNKLDFIAASFIRNKEEVEAIREILIKNNSPETKIISKIENQEGIDNLDSIINASDGIMVARGDLWIEVPIEKLPIYQQKIIEKCREKGRFVIVATHFLESMIWNPFPTRAESSDIYNAVCQKPDCVMLSGETSVWKYPIESVQMMVKMIEQAEKNTNYSYQNYSDEGLRESDIEKKYMIRSGLYLSKELKAKAVIIFTKTWLLARLTSAFKPSLPVFAFTKFEKTEKILNIFFWIQAFFLENWNQENYEQNLENAIKKLIEIKKVRITDSVIVINDIQKKGREIPILEVIKIKNFIDRAE
jgi:pyruvate kinase